MIKYVPLQEIHFKAVIALGNTVHGDNYLDDKSIEQIYRSSWANDINCSWVAVDTLYLKGAEDNARILTDGLLVGFRLTLAPQHWQIDNWCSPTMWSVSPNKVCYFKCNTVDANYRGKGIGKALLTKSIDTCKQQGAQAGLAHIWLASPNNSAFGYFSACGGTLVKKHANKWQIHSIEDNYECPICGDLCKCTAAEMILVFEENA